MEILENVLNKDLFKSKLEYNYFNFHLNLIYIMHNYHINDVNFFDRHSKQYHFVKMIKFFI